MTILNKPSEPAAVATLPPPDDHQKPLRIIPSGGYVDRYYTAIPAISIMSKYPRSVLATPDVFHRPWDSLVLPDEILKPGEKFYILPHGTFRKLRKQIGQPKRKKEGQRFVNAWQPSLMSIKEI